MGVAKLSITFFPHRLKQPQVVCEMIAGVLLDPSFESVYGKQARASGELGEVPQNA